MEQHERTNPITCLHNIVAARITDELELLVKCLSCSSNLNTSESRIKKNYQYDKHSGLWIHTPKRRNNKVEQTPREEFQSHFECCTDEKWQWLKEFCERQYIPDNRTVREWLNGVIGYKIGDNMYHPTDVEIIHHGRMERPQTRTDTND